MSRSSLLYHSMAAAKLGFIAAVALYAAWAPIAFAQNSDAKDGDGRWSIGLGVVTFDKVYRDFDRKVVPLPIVSYENTWVSLGIPISDIKLYSDHALDFRLRARLAIDGYEAKDSPILAGLDDRKFSVWTGGAVIWKTKFVNITGELLADAMGNSGGTRAKLQIDRRFAAGKFGFTPRLATEWVNDKYVNYYYGVMRSEAQTSRPFYEGKSTTNMQIGLHMDYTPARHHVVFLDAGATRVGSTIRDSPLVNKSYQTSLAVGYVYRF